MSNRAVTWAYKQRHLAGQPLKGGMKFVLVTLADMADSQHSCFPGINELSELTGIAPATVRQHIGDLIAGGLVAREARRRRDGSRTSNRYYLDVDGALAVFAEQPPDSGDGQQPESGDGQAPDSRQNKRQILEGSKDNPHLTTNHHSSSSAAADAAARPELIRLLDLLDELIIANGGKPPSRTKRNLDAARLLVDRDGRSVDQIERAIRWCQADEFWRANILSMSKLREKYDQLRLAAQRSPQQGRVTNARRNLATVQSFLELEQEPGQIEASA